MIITIGGTDYTNFIPQDSIEIDWQLSDPVPTAKFDVEDVGSQLSFSFMQAVAIKPDTDTSQPTTNLVVDPTFAQAGAKYTTSGTFTITYPGNTVQLHCSNASAADGWSAQTTLAGLVSAGVTYMYSAYLAIGSNFTNANTFLKMEFLDSGLSVLSTVSGTTYNTAMSRTRINISGTAPANTAYIKFYTWLHESVSGNNSATCNYDTLQLEAESNATLTYPTNDCVVGDQYCMVQSNGTTLREQRYFSGYILNRKRLYSGNNRVIQIDAVSAGYFLKKVLSSSTYNNQTGSAILINLISTYLSNYVTTGHVITTASDTTFDTISWNDVYVADAFQSVVKASGWDYFVDAWNDLHYQPPGYTQTAFGLSDNPDGVTTFPYYDYEWDSDGSQVSDRITVHGGGKAWIAPATTDTFSGNGSNKQFTLTNQPRSVHSVTVGGTTKKVGLTGINTFSQGYDVLVDKPNSQINFNSAPANSANNVTCTYTYLGPALVRLTDASAVGTNAGVPIFDAKVEDSTLVTQGDAYQRGLEELIQYSTPITTLKLKTQQALQIGDTVPITSAGDSLSSQPFMIQRVKIRPLGTGPDGNQILEYDAELGPYVHDLAHLLLHVHKHVKNASTHTSISPEEHVVALEYLTYSEGLSTTTGNTGGGSGGGGAPSGSPGSGATALTVYGTNVGASTLPNACKLLTASGSPSTTKGQTKLGTATGWGELTPKGSSSAWAALGAMGSPTGKGFLLDATTLAGHSFPDGNWSAALTLRVNNATSATGTITTNVYKYSASGTYTLMGSLTKTSQTVTTSNVTFNFSATEFSTFNFISGDKLYCDVWMNVTSSSGVSSTSEIWLNHISTSNSVGDPTCEWVSPGYN